MSQSSQLEALQTTINSLADATLLVDDQARLHAFNDTAVALLGYAGCDILNMPAEKFIPPRQHLRHPELRHIFHAHSVAARLGVDRPLRVRRADGIEIPVEVRDAEIANVPFMASADGMQC